MSDSSNIAPMSHQPTGTYVHNEETDDYDFLQESYYETPPKKTWKLRQYIGAKNGWSEDGTLTIRQSPYEGDYLEATTGETPFFSISADIDQWGTYYSIKLGKDGNEENPPTIFVYAQEWGTPSFLKTLGTALIEYADANEARSGRYDREYVIEVTPEETKPEIVSEDGSAFMDMESE